MTTRKEPVAKGETIKITDRCHFKVQKVLVLNEC